LGGGGDFVGELLEGDFAGRALGAFGSWGAAGGAVGALGAFGALRTFGALRAFGTGVAGGDVEGEVEGVAADG
jgi:hypothetical protein